MRYKNRSSTKISTARQLFHNPTRNFTSQTSQDWWCKQFSSSPFFRLYTINFLLMSNKSLVFDLFFPNLVLVPKYREKLNKKKFWFCILSFELGWLQEKLIVLADWIHSQNPSSFWFSMLTTVPLIQIKQNGKIAYVKLK